MEEVFGEIASQPYVGKSDFVEYVVYDLLLEFQGIRSRAMFGGYGIYRDSVIFAIIVDDQLYFKADDTNKKEYEKKGSKPFTYESSRGKPVSMSYWEVPADVMDDREEIKLWAEKSYQISRKLKQPAGRGSAKRRSKYFKISRAE